MTETKAQLLAELREMRSAAQKQLNTIDEKISKYETENERDDENAYDELRKIGK